MLHELQICHGAKAYTKDHRTDLSYVETTLLLSLNMVFLALFSYKAPIHS